MLRPSNDDAALANLIDELGRTREEKAKLENREAFLRDQILERTEGRNDYRPRGGEFELRVLEQDWQTFDKDTFKNDHPALYEEYAGHQHVTVVRTTRIAAKHES
ncbi:MAG: hypothetical protein BGP07_13140 [Rhizobiales bacterium 63-22]|nr:MAG: hypothetical protein BGP07_13140 [Rhizobiales bacterium 63-22]